MMDYRGKNVLVMGLGLHGGGTGSANYFLSKGARVTVTDLKSEEELGPSITKLLKSKEVRLVCGRHDYGDFRDADLVIKNPAVPPDSPYIRHALEHGVPVDTDIGVFLDGIKDKTRNVVGVTGTKGKSTTATLLHSIISSVYGHAVLGGNITVSVLDLLDGVKPDAYVILELSSFQLGGIRGKGYSPPIAVFTNFLEDHMNYYGSREEYFEDKTVLYRFQKEGDVLLVNRDDPALTHVQARRGVKLVTFGVGEDFSGDGSFIRGEGIFVRSGGLEQFVMKTKDLKLPGEHNLSNVLAAVAAAGEEGIPIRAIAEAVKNFHGIPHRLEYLGRLRGVAFYNDTAATMPDAAVRGMACFSGPLTLIAGGSDKGLSLETFAGSINERVSALVLLEGSGTKRLLECGIRVPFKMFDNLGEAFGYACKVTPPSGTVLLSPGFASFGMFRNEFDRGDRFRDLVRELSGERKG